MCVDILQYYLSFILLKKLKLKYTIIAYFFILLYNIISLCGYSLVVESHASDLVARVRFSLPAPKTYLFELIEQIDTNFIIKIYIK